MENRRNYYRILQVQPDAPTEVIRSSYRTLMHTLKQHPDLGGDHWNAAILNEAYETLSDIRKRTEYDSTFLKEKPLRRESVQTPDTEEFCPVCKKPLSGKESCLSCSPLKKSSSASSVEAKMESDVRRHMPRMKKSGDLSYSDDKTDRYKEAVMIDFSTKGVRFRCSEKLNQNKVIKLSSPVLDATAKIHSIHDVRSGDGITSYTIGAEFISVFFKKPKGSFVFTSG